MDRIDKYLNSIYRDIESSSEGTEDLKQEMKYHLIQTVKELQQNGITEEESVRIAIQRFGEEFQIRNELNQVLRFEKLFAKKTLIASFILLAISAILVITSIMVHQGSVKRLKTMNSQLRIVEKILVSEGITSVDTYLKESFKYEENNQLTYVAIKELPHDFDNLKEHEVFPGEIKYSYPKKIKNEYYRNRFGHEVVVNNTKYFLETGVKTSANTDMSSLYSGLAVLVFAVCWVLWIIWSIINVYRCRKLNINWCILLILTGIIGYFIFSMYFNPNNISHNKRNNLIYVGSFFLIGILLAVFHLLNEPYKLQRIYQLIF
ncbi:permease prefix domain 1-containing protein [Clostridium lundense]|uniref:permease prefix domain 1-containing protein n=1 Tax=Clostridium lundense TaxID=319475 RepID=UPI000487DB4C|nr:permease prefix domain 1-containing protein [Clostridium lundense]